jgi:hypothetical protein
VALMTLALNLRFATPRAVLAAVALAASAAALGQADPDQRAPQFGAPQRPAFSRLLEAPSSSGTSLQRTLDELAQEGVELNRVASATPSAAAAPAPAAAPTASAADDRRFVARAGEPLSAALAAYLGRQNWDLEWNAPQDFLIQRGYELVVPGGADLRATLVQILTPYRLSAVIHNAPPQRVVAVAAAAAREP